MVFALVRQLSLRLLYQKKGEKYNSEGKETAAALAFALAESIRKNRRITAVTTLTLPFWIVQVTESESILLSSLGLETQTIEVSENRNLGAIKRIISSATSEPETIPNSVTKALELLANVEKSVQHINSLMAPSPIIDQSNLYITSDPTEQQNRPHESVDSQKALDISTQFQDQFNSTKTRLDEIEELRSFAHEHLRDKVSAIENVFGTEAERWERRLRTQEEITELEISELEEKKQDSIYELQQKHKMTVRGITAELTRALQSIEDHFDSLGELTRETRITMGQVGEDVTKGFDIFSDLVQTLDERTPLYKDAVSGVKKEIAEIQKRLSEMEKTLADDIESVSAEIDSQIRERKLRLVEFDMERSQKKNEMEDLQEQAKLAVNKFERAIEERIQQVRSELNAISEYAFNHLSIENIAPLTHLDVEVLAVEFEDETSTILTPGISPSERFSIPLEYEVISNELGQWIQETISSYMEQSRAFKDNVHSLILSSSMLHETAEDLLNPGLRNLEGRQLLNEGVKEKLQLRWNEYKGRCPDCGSDITPEAQFCAACGKVLK